MPSGDPSIFGLPCRFPAASSFSPEDRVQSHDSKRISRQRESEKKFFPEFPVAAGKGRGGATCLRPFGAAAASGSGVADPASQSPLLRSERFLDRRRDAEIGLEQPAEEARSERAQWIDRDLRVGG